MAVTSSFYVLIPSGIVEYMKVIKYIMFGNIREICLRMSGNIGK